MLAARERGASISACAGAAEINPATLTRWLEDDEDFRDAFDAAKGRFETRALKQISRAAQDPRRWQAAAWLLERVMPERYSLSQRGGGDGQSSDNRIPVQLAVLIQQMVHAPAALPDQPVEGDFREIDPEDLDPDEVLALEGVDISGRKKMHLRPRDVRVRHLPIDENVLLEELGIADAPEGPAGYRATTPPPSRSQED